MKEATLLLKLTVPGVEGARVVEVSIPAERLQQEGTLERHVAPAWAILSAHFEPKAKP